MAGIGFELKRLFDKKGILATVRAYGYAGMVCTGPMLLGIILQLGVMLLADKAAALKTDRDLLVSMITYALLASLAVTSLLSMITTRCTADYLYTKENEKIMPSFYGSLLLMLLFGSIGYGIFLHFSGVEPVYQILSLLLFVTLIIVWTEINYLTAIKDYRSIVLTFVLSIVITFITGYLLIRFTNFSVIASLLFSVCVGYGLMAVVYFILLYRYFPEGFGTSMNFLRWADKFPHLGGISFFITLGLFGHLVIMWSSPLGSQIKGLFYGAPVYDVAALAAFLSILITTINFVTSVEVRFYPQYRNYFSLFNEGGSISDIETAEGKMLKVLQSEIYYLAQKQAFTTILFVVVGSLLLPRLPLGFTPDMLGIFRVLCVGYAFYAVGNSVMLILLYFADNQGAFRVSLSFAVITNLLTWILKYGNPSFYGFGFVAGGVVFCLLAFLRLDRYLSKLKYHVLGEQPVFEAQVNGLPTRLADRLDKRAQMKQRKRKQYIDGKTAPADSSIGIPDVR